jgi:hypothetical protein
MKYGGVSVLSCHIIYPFMVPLSYPIHVCIYIHIMYLIKHVPHQACIYISLYQYQYQRYQGIQNGPEDLLNMSGITSLYQ